MCCAVLCCAVSCLVLCCAVLCATVLCCCAVLCCALPRCVVLYCLVLCCVDLCCTVLCCSAVLYCAALLLYCISSSVRRLPLKGTGVPLYVKRFATQEVPSPLQTPHRSNAASEPMTLSHPNLCTEEQNRQNSEKISNPDEVLSSAQLKPSSVALYKCTVYLVVEKFDKGNAISGKWHVTGTVASCPISVVFDEMSVVTVGGST